MQIYYFLPLTQIDSKLFMATSETRVTKSEPGCLFVSLQDRPDYWRFGYSARRSLQAGVDRLELGISVRQVMFAIRRGYKPPLQSGTLGVGMDLVAEGMRVLVNRTVIASRDP